MKLFIYNPKKYNPLIFIIAKVSSKEENDNIELFANDIFQLLIDNKTATDSNTLIFSVIKDYDKTTRNLILPSNKSNAELVNNCINKENTNVINNIIIDILIHNDSEFFLEFVFSDNNTKILIHTININLSSLSKYYKYINNI
jgi:hypothetical protein